MFGFIQDFSSGFIQDFSSGFIQVSYRFHTGFIQVSYRFHTGFIQVSYRFHTGFIQVATKTFYRCRFVVNRFTIKEVVWIYVECVLWMDGSTVNVGAGEGVGGSAGCSRQNTEAYPSWGKIFIYYSNI